MRASRPRTQQRPLHLFVLSLAAALPLTLLLSLSPTQCRPFPERSNSRHVAASRLPARVQEMMAGMEYLGEMKTIASEDSNPGISSKGNALPAENAGVSLGIEYLSKREFVDTTDSSDDMSQDLWTRGREEAAGGDSNMVTLLHHGTTMGEEQEKIEVGGAYLGEVIAADQDSNRGLSPEDNMLMGETEDFPIDDDVITPEMTSPADEPELAGYATQEGTSMLQHLFRVARYASQHPKHPNTANPAHVAPANTWGWSWRQSDVAASSTKGPGPSMSLLLRRASALLGIRSGLLEGISSDSAGGDGMDMDSYTAFPTYDLPIEALPESDPVKDETPSHPLVFSPLHKRLMKNVEELWNWVSRKHHMI